MAVTLTASNTLKIQILCVMNSSFKLTICSSISNYTWCKDYMAHHTNNLRMPSDLPLAQVDRSSSDVLWVARKTETTAFRCLGFCLFVISAQN